MKKSLIIIITVLVVLLFLFFVTPVQSKKHVINSSHESGKAFAFIECIQDETKVSESSNN